MAIRSLKTSSIANGVKRSKFWDQTTGLITNYMAVIDSTTDTINGTDILYDSSGVYLTFINSAATNFGAMKLNTAGSAVQWAVTENLGTYSGYNGVSKASDGNMVYSGYNNQSGRVTARAKLDASTGAQIWSYYYNLNGYGNGGTIDGAGNIWSAQQVSGGAGLFRTDGDGASPTAWTINGATYCTKATYIASQNKIYGLVTGPASQYHLTLFVVNPDGSTHWQYEINTLYSTDGGIVADSSGNIYVATYGADSATTGGRAYLFKINSSGSLVAQKMLDQGTGNFDAFQECVIDATNGFIYAVGIGNDRGLIAKYDLSLNLQWQRTLTGVSQLNSIQLIDANNILVTGQYGGTGGGIFNAQLKTDGSGTGTYTFTNGNVVYAASSLSNTTPSLSISTPGRGVSSTSPSRTSTTTINDAVTTTIETKVV
jgi:hypothetical protein